MNALRRLRIRAIVLALATLLLGACSLLGRPEPLVILAPRAPMMTLDAGLAVDWSIQIQRPMADQMRDSDRVLVRRAPARLQVYPGVAWLDSVPEMLQSMMIQAFADSHGFASVSRAGAVRTRFGLNTELRSFELVDDAEGRRVELALQASLVHQRTGRVVSSRSFTVRSQVLSGDLDAVVLAFESALAELLPQLVQWARDAGQVSIERDGRS
ncbi:ABC-type transport auxiliary lipoprotein family protein [Wenzhouxiangella marina]|uniref:ABC-type transport auxiliary lipoprotein component domain-containing protein n=1 Tax=Wenzhouxiangella marina TaxID=1579979 RepID=A0A0K0XYV1_9GAMM|nr:ABC-type transport auxiliary lipoprotein family protein [Wenzhouxiangella marina]AKS42863.1 hypothetical protein WM2015_2505 [Wenzhouxiangella marina]MBB6087455.1 cholesterol transport system auxiliary component [Wenzhouxiangella marina]